MKKLILILLAIIISGKVSFGQNDLTETEKFAFTAKVWGFLKYYHPDVASGKYNWDKQLFEILPKIKSSTSKEQLSQIYIDWIDTLGNVGKCKNCGQDQELQYFEKNFDLKWIKNKRIFTNELTEKLEFIESNRHQGKKYYVSMAGNIEFTNEMEYRNFDWQDENLRLLTLFRYWNTIEYFFPYKYQTDTDWDEVLNNMIPKFLYPKTEVDYHLSILELIVSIDDTHAGYLALKTQAFFGSYFFPVSFKLIDNKAVINSIYNDSLARIDDLKVGDVISKVNDKDVRTIFKEKEIYINGSNTSSKKLNASYAIFNGSSDSVFIEFERNGRIQSKSVSRYLFKQLSPHAAYGFHVYPEHFNFNKKESDPFKILDGNIGYVNMGVLEVEDVPDVMESLNKTKAIIFDIRNYPKGTVNHLSKYISSKKNDFYKITYPDLTYPGKFIWTNGRQSSASDELKYKGKVVLLVNERTISHAEFTVMCLQTGDNVTTIGSQTSGADGNIILLKMVDGYKTAISGIGIFYPDGTETQRKGVKIDIEINPTIQGINKGRDEVLDKAIEFVNE